MNSYSTKREIIEKAYKYLFDHLDCHLHSTRHYGRFAYSLILGNELDKSNSRLQNPNQSAINLLMNQISTKDNLYYLHPGIANKRNYSTNMIDIGIFLHSISEIGQNYSVDFELIDCLLLSQIQNMNASRIHNQRLWLTYGILRYAEFRTIDRLDEIHQLALRSVNTWIDTINSNGEAPYFDKKRELDGSAYYYHSRTLLFAVLILQKVGRLEHSLHEKLQNAFEAMLFSYINGTDRNKYLESKRYYFRGENDFFSLVFDAVLISKSAEWNFEIPSTINSSEFLTAFFNRLFKSPLYETSTQKNWQCDYMGISYLAWLTFLPDGELSQSLEKNSKIASLIRAGEIIEIDSERSVITQKTPLDFTGGQLSGGLIKKMAGKDFSKDLLKIEFRGESHSWSLYPNFMIILDLSRLRTNIINCYHIIWEYWMQKKYRMCLITFGLWMRFELIDFFVVSTKFDCLLKFRSNPESSEITYERWLCDTMGNRVKFVGLQRLNRKIAE